MIPIDRTDVPSTAVADRPSLGTYAASGSTGAAPWVARVARSRALRSPWVPLGSLLIQQVLHRRGASPWLGFPFHVIATLWVVVVTLQARHLLSRLGGWLVVLGSVMNGVIIAASGARMPIDPAAWARLHDGPLLNKERMHVAVTGGWRAPLSDHLVVRPLTAVVSPGDLVLVAGGVLVAVGIVLGRRATRRSERWPVPHGSSPVRSAP